MVLVPLLAAAVLAAQQSRTADTIYIAATTDVHGRATAWDYERDREAPLGLVRAKTVIDSLRRAHPGRVILVDAGDLLQGNPFTTYYARHPAATHPVIDAMNRMGYDALTLGNHEFNYGVPALNRALARARMPVLSANILRVAGSPAYRASTVVRRGSIRVGIVGATTPGVLVWDGANVAGRLRFRPLLEAVPPESRALRRRADVTVLVAHAGLADPSSYADSAAPPENQVAATIAASDLDVTVIGHTHREIADSTVGSTLVVQPRNWAQSVAVVTVALRREAGRWVVASKRGTIIPLAGVRPDSALAAALAPAHQRVRAWATAPLGRSTDAMPAARARIEDSPVIDFVAEVMRRRSGADLAATAAFNTTGGIRAGDVTFADLTSIYPYDNTLRAVRISGGQLRAYLEQAARYWQGMGPDGPVPNDSIPGYNFDLLTGVQYEYDLGQPYGRRLARLLWQGREVREADSFTVALNNYRQQGGGGFGMLAGAPVVYDRGEDIRELLAEEVTRRGTIAAGEWHQVNWRIRGVTGATVAPPDWRGGSRPVIAGARSDSILLRVLSTNDFHAAMESAVQSWSNRRPVGGAAMVAGMMNRLAGECGGCPVIRLDGGDVMQGRPASNLTFGRAMVDIYNAMRYDAAAIGNHEFDWGIDTLVARIRQARFRWLASNIRELSTRQRPAWAMPWTMVQAGPRRVAVVGYVTPGTVTSTAPANVASLGFLRAPALDSAIAEARAQRPDFVVVVAHEGAFCNQDSGCAGEIVNVANALTHKPDLIVSGHTHSLVTHTTNGIAIIQQRTAGSSLGVTDFLAADSGRAPRMRVETVWADRETADTAVARVVEAALAEVRPLTSRIVAELGQDFPRSEPQYPLADMIVDAVRNAGRADIALINNTGVRNGLFAGAVTWGQLFEVLPFGNLVVTMPVTGAVLKQALEHALRNRDAAASVSGMRVRVNAGAAAGSRVAQVTLDDGRVVQDDAVYTLATLDFLAGGGSGYAMLRNRPLANTGIDELDAFIEYLRRQPQPVRAAQPHVPRIFTGN